MNYFLKNEDRNKIKIINRIIANYGIIIKNRAKEKIKVGNTNY